MTTSPATLESRCDLLRSLHRPGAPLLLPNVWDVATARAVVEAGFPVVATTSEAVAATLGYEDDERAPAGEMLAAAARIARSVEAPVTVDAEAGYGMDPGDLVSALQSAGAAGGNLEDTDHLAGRLRDPDLSPFLAGAGPGAQEELVPEALQRADAARIPKAGPVAELTALGVARVSWGPFLHWDAMAHFKERLASLQS